MESCFTKPIHEKRFFDMMAEDDTSFGDCERISLFYIISGNDDLYRKRRFIYDPGRHVIRTCLDHGEEVDFSSGMRSLIRLGFNLYNGWSDDYTTPRFLLGSLDEDNLVLAYNAMRIRFQEKKFKELME